MEPPGNPSDSMTDITALLRSAVSDLEIGQMVHGPKFSLFEAMSALEMFDPKMDPRLGFNPEHTEPDCEYQWLTESDAIQAMDRLLQCESYFYSGTTLLHSVLLCAWLHDCNQLMLPTEHLPTIAVRAYSLAVLRCINRIVDALYTSDVVYEEDITLERFGFSLGESIPSSYILESIDRAISLFPEQSPVWLRLQYRRHLLHAFEYFFGNNSANFRHAFSYLGSCIESVDKLNLPEDECCPKISYFDLSVPCNYLASCPPRLIKLKSPKQSLLQQKDLFEQLMCLSYFPADSTADQLLQFSSAFATCLPANIIPRACLYLLSLSVSNIQPSYRLFLRCLSMNRSRAHRFTSKLFAACLTLPSPDFALMVLIHHVEAMLELELLSPQEYSSVFFILDALYSSLTAATMTRFMRGCMLLAKGLLLSYLSFSLCASQEQTPLIDQEYIFSHRFSLVYRHLENFPTCAKFQSTVSFIRSQELRSTIERASKYFEDAKSCFSDGHFVMPNQEKRARRLATIAGCNCASVKSLSSRMGQAISVRWIGDHTYPIIRSMMSSLLNCDQRSRYVFWLCAYNDNCKLSILTRKAFRDGWKLDNVACLRIVWGCIITGFGMVYCLSETTPRTLPTIASAIIAATFAICLTAVIGFVCYDHYQTKPNHGKTNRQPPVQAPTNSSISHMADSESKSKPVVSNIVLGDDPIQTNINDQEYESNPEQVETKVDEYCMPIHTFKGNNYHDKRTRIVYGDHPVPEEDYDKMSFIDIEIDSGSKAEYRQNIPADGSCNNNQPNRCQRSAIPGCETDISETVNSCPRSSYQHDMAADSNPNSAEEQIKSPQKPSRPSEADLQRYAVSMIKRCKHSLKLFYRSGRYEPVDDESSWQVFEHFASSSKYYMQVVAYRLKNQELEHMEQFRRICRSYEKRDEDNPERKTFVLHSDGIREFLDSFQKYKQWRDGKSTDCLQYADRIKAKRYDDFLNLAAICIAKHLDHIIEVGERSGNFTIRHYQRFWNFSKFARVYAMLPDLPEPLQQKLNELENAILSIRSCVFDRVNGLRSTIGDSKSSSKKTSLSSNKASSASVGYEPPKERKSSQDNSSPIRTPNLERHCIQNNENMAENGLIHDQQFKTQCNPAPVSPERKVLSRLDNLPSVIKPNGKPASKSTALKIFFRRKRAGLA